MIILFILPFIIAGLVIAWVFGIKPSVENIPTIEDHYEKSGRENK